jgi:hypothetical protein
MLEMAAERLTHLAVRLTLLRLRPNVVAVVGAVAEVTGLTTNFTPVVAAASC